MTNNTDTVTDSAALVVDGQQPVWMTLNDAREQAFTGEIVFESDPEVLAYLDNGIVYFAERAGDDSLAKRLLDAGVVDTAQLERGLVRIGDLEHLGRLFDRDASIDRDAVVVTAELFTEELISGVANQMIANVRVAAYRHHPSGLHRWFVAPVDQTSVTRPIGHIGQLDGMVIDDLPGLPYGLDEDEFMIEWDAIGDSEFDPATLDDAVVEDVEEIDAVAAAELDETALELSLELAEFVDVADAIEADSDVEPQAEDVAELQPVEVVDEVVEIDAAATTELDETAPEPSVELAEFVDVADVVEAESDVEPQAENLAEVQPAEVADDDVEPDEYEFSVVWPDGSEHLADGASVDIEEQPAAEPSFTETDDGELQFSMPPLALSDEPEAADAEVPDDVAEAVRRAIAAIESASVGEPDDDVAKPGFELSLDLDDSVETQADVEGADVSEVDESGAVEIEFTEIEYTDVEFIEADEIPDVEIAADPEVAARGEAAPAADGFAGFAPPTMATRAEVLYGQMSDEGAVLDAAVAAPTLTEQPSDTTPVEELSGNGGERSSALRRLIGSLRRKDH